MARSRHPSSQTATALSALAADPLEWRFVPPAPPPPPVPPACGRAPSPGPRAGATVGGSVALFRALRRGSAVPAPAFSGGRTPRAGAPRRYGLAGGLTVGAAWFVVFSP